MLCMVCYCLFYVCCDVCACCFFLFSFCCVFVCCVLCVLYSFVGVTVERCDCILSVMDSVVMFELYWVCACMHGYEVNVGLECVREWECVL